MDYRKLLVVKCRNVSKIIEKGVVLRSAATCAARRQVNLIRSDSYRSSRRKLFGKVFCWHLARLKSESGRCGPECGVGGRPGASRGNPEQFWHRLSSVFRRGCRKVFQTWSRG